MKYLLSILFLITPLQAKVILISFDGSGYFDRWQGTLDFAKANPGVHFTYFISAPYFCTESQIKDHPYWAIQEKGEPLVKITKDQFEPGVKRRFVYLHKAVAEGHEIASHLCGHYDGTKWTYEDWMKEREFFEWVMTQGGFDMKNIIGVRTPYLAVNKAYFKAFFSKPNPHYKYDSSMSSSMYNNVWDGVLSRQKEFHFGFVSINIYPITVVYGRTTTKGAPKRVLPFDDAFVSIISTYLTGSTPAEMEKVYFDSLCNDYLTTSEVTQVCLHFEHHEGEPYLRAMEHFVAWVKDKNPEFLTYREYVKDTIR